MLLFFAPFNTKKNHDSIHNRRLAFSALRNKYAVSELFRVVAEKVSDRPGGYTRVIKMGNRLGDNASMAMIELVDFNEVYNKENSVGKKSTRRSRSRKKGENIQTTVPAEAVKEQIPEYIKEETLEKSPKSKVKKTANKLEDKKASEPEKEGDE